MAGDPSLTPELIQARSFSSGFRGYDQSEVRDFLGRVATEVRALRERADQLESAWRSAEERGLPTAGVRRGNPGGRGR